MKFINKYTDYITQNRVDIRVDSKSVSCSFTANINPLLTNIIKTGRKAVSFIHQWLYSPLSGPGPFFSFANFYTAGGTPWTGDKASIGYIIASIHFLNYTALLWL
jgi:hypothetical protein